MIIVKTQDNRVYIGAVDAIGGRVRNHVVYRRHGPFRNVDGALRALENVTDEENHGANDHVVFCLTDSVGTISVRKCCVASRIAADCYEQVTDWFPSITDAEQELEFVERAGVLAAPLS